MRYKALATIAFAQTLGACGSGNYPNSSSSAVAETEAVRPSLICYDHSKADTGLTVSFFKDGGSHLVRAKLGELWIGGTRPVVELRDVTQVAAPRHPDLAVVYMIFTEQAAQAPYKIGLTTGNFAGIQFARVSKEGGSVTDLPCRASK